MIERQVILVALIACIAGSFLIVAKTYKEDNQTTISRF